MKLLHRLLLLSIVPSLLILLVGLYAAGVAETSLRRSIAASADARATAILDEIDREIASRIGEWTAYSQSSTVRRVLRNSNRALEIQPDRERFIDREDSLWLATPETVTSPMMTRLLDHEMSVDLRAMLREMQRNFGYPIFGEVFITNRFGANVIQSGRTTDFRQNDEAWWQQAFANGVYLGEIAFDSSSRLYSTAICLRIDDENGAPLGVLKAVHNIQGVFALLDRRSEMAGDGVASNFVFLTASKQLIYAAGTSAPPLTDGSRYFRDVDLSSSSGPVTLERFDEVSGQKMLSTYVTSSFPGNRNGPQWVLLCEAEAEKAFHPIHHLRGRILLIAVVAMLLTGTHATGYSFSLSRRITRLSKVALALGRGEDSKADARGSDELSQLAGSFNAMSESLSIAETALLDRTTSLEAQNLRLENEMAERHRVEAERDTIEVRLRHAQKLEAVGQLAAGIAHEINTPMQYINHNTVFLRDASQDLMRLAETSRLLLTAHVQGTPSQAQIEEAAELINRMDLDYLLEEVPRSIEQCLDGITRVTKIVGAMKSFSHPGEANKTAIDINEAIRTTITVAQNEWKYVADLVTDLDPDLPVVPCLAGEVNQALLNLIVNAAHAIDEKVQAQPQARGTITVRTRREEKYVLIQVEDTGAGIPEGIRGRIFDPFFTTKEVGKGTGQGLAIVHMVVVQAHGGTVDVHSEPGRGSLFEVRLPLETTSGTRLSEAA